MRMTASWFRSHVDRPNTRVWRDDPRPMASSPLIVEARLSPSNLSSSLRTGSDDGTRAATGIFGRRDRANRAAVPSVHIAMLTRLIRMEAKTPSARSGAMAVSGREPSRPKSLDIRPHTRAAVPSVHIAMLTRTRAKTLRQGPERWQCRGREPSRPKSLDIRHPIQGPDGKLVHVVDPAEVADVVAWLEELGHHTIHLARSSEMRSASSSMKPTI